MPTQVANMDLVDLLRPWFCEKPCGGGADCPWELCSPDGLIVVGQTDNDAGMMWYGDGADTYHLLDKATIGTGVTSYYWGFDTDIASHYIEYTWGWGGILDQEYVFNDIYVEIYSSDSDLQVFTVVGDTLLGNDLEVGAELEVNGSALIWGSCDIRAFLTLNDRLETIAAGIITVDGSYSEVETAGGVATDDLDTINGGTDGDLIILTAANDAHTVVCKHNTGNLHLAGGADFSLDSVSDTLMLIYNGSDWLEISRSDNG